MFSTWIFNFAEIVIIKTIETDVILFVESIKCINQGIKSTKVLTLLH